MARENEQVVRRAEGVGRQEALDVLVAVDVDLLAGLREPVLEAQVITAVAIGHAAAGVRARHVDVVRLPVRVPSNTIIRNQ